jgi:NADP-dependent 3-hydroxy acid dehydrogenase YdfG
VKDLLKQGNTVIGTARDPETAAAFKELSEQYKDKFVPTALDASLPDSIAAWADQLKSRVSHIDVSCAVRSVCQKQRVQQVHRAWDTYVPAVDYMCRWCIIVFSCMTVAADTSWKHYPRRGGN